MLRNVLFYLFTHFSIGLIFTIIFIDRKKIGSLYFRVTTFVACVLLCFALLARPFGDIEVMALLNQVEPVQLTYLLFIFCVIFLVIFNFLYPKIYKHILLTILLLGFLAVAFSSIVIAQQSDAKIVEFLLFVINAIASTLLLGSVLGSMITGHWYLVQHNLSLVPLKKSSLIYLISVFLRIVFLFITIFVFFIIDRKLIVELLVKFDINGYIFWGRFLFGLIIPLIFGFMIWGAVKIRSTQSATGILYATIVFILIGEAFARFLFFFTGLSL